MLVQLFAESKQVVNLDLDGDVIVGNVLLRVRQSFGNNLADLTVLEIFVGD